MKKWNKPTITVSPVAMPIESVFIWNSGENPCKNPDPNQRPPWCGTLCLTAIKEFFVGKEKVTV